MKFLIELNDDIQNFDEYVTVTKKNGEMVEGIYKMTLNHLLRELEDATSKEEDKIETPLLPINCLKFVRKSVIESTADIYILVPKQQWDITFYDNPMKQVGFPKMIFKYCVEKSRVSLSTIVAVKDDGPVHLDSPIHYFPFSHVSTNGSVCMGGNAFPPIERIQQIETFHNLFLASPFTSDYGAKSTTGKSVNQLFDSLVNKNFDDDWLLPIIRENEDKTKKAITLGEYFNLQTI